MEQCVELCELVDGDASKFRGYSNAVIYDINLIMKEEIKYLEHRKAHLLQKLEEQRKIVADFEADTEGEENDEA